MASPIWLYEIWAFIVPGLHRNERKWTMIFVSIAGPLFLAGVVLGYYVMPKGLAVLLGSRPTRSPTSSTSGLPQLHDPGAAGLRHLVRDPAVRGPAQPGRRRAGRHLARWRSWIIFGTFVFAAVATPSTDPITMLFLAVPMVILFLISEVIAHIVDRRRGVNRADDYS